VARQGDEEDRRAFRQIFAETGHRTLNALLIVSGGAAVSFMTFLGTAMAQPGVPIEGLLSAMQMFVASVAGAVLAHGFTYGSHMSFHFDRRLLGNWLMALAMGAGLACVVLFVLGSLAAMSAFGAMRATS
jgi:hypothetical protein